MSKSTPKNLFDQRDQPRHHGRVEGIAESRVLSQNPIVRLIVGET
jgi:hypothetical protein